MMVAHIYPQWVSEGTCSTKCVDLLGDEEFCVATSVCEQGTWRRAFKKHVDRHNELNDFDLSLSISHCEVWGDSNRCDGTLCDADQDCQSGCCGEFASFTHARCLPMLGNYCAGRDTTRRRAQKLMSPKSNDDYDYDDDDVQDAVPDDIIDRELEALKARERMLKDKESLLQLNELPSNDTAIPV